MLCCTQRYIRMHAHAVHWGLRYQHNCSTVQGIAEGGWDQKEVYTRQRGHKLAWPRTKDACCKAKAGFPHSSMPPFLMVTTLHTFHHRHVQHAYHSNTRNVDWRTPSCAALTRNTSAPRLVTTSSFDKADTKVSPPALSMLRSPNLILSHMNSTCSGCWHTSLTAVQFVLVHWLKHIIKAMITAAVHDSRSTARTSAKMLTKYTKIQDLCCRFCAAR
jgi:hypothetical protein